MHPSQQYAGAPEYSQQQPPLPPPPSAAPVAPARHGINMTIPSQPRAAFVHAPTPREQQRPATSQQHYPFSLASERTNTGIGSVTNSFHRPQGTYREAANLYPSTLMPSRQIQAQQHSRQPPVKLLQSCDSCRRRKIRCSGEKPTCSSCIRYQEMCHYSPLATPRRRAGKRAKTQHSGSSASAHVAGPAATSAADKLQSREPGAGATDDDDLSAPAAGQNSVPEESQNSAADTDSHAAGPGAAGGWHTEAGEMRRHIADLSTKFDSLSGKLDRLIGIVSKRRRSSDAGSSSEEGGSDGSECEYEYDDNDGDEDGARNASESLEFSNSIDKTSRFGLDATNVGIISDMMSSFNDASAHGRQPVEGVRVSSQTASNSTAPPPAHGQAGGNDSRAGQQVGDDMALGGSVANFARKLDEPAMRDHLIDTFYLTADVNTISFIPRHVFLRLQGEKRVPTSMINVMMADACNHSEDESLLAVGRGFARGYFIERAYKALFECLEYDSVEHCVALLLFAMITSKAGLHRAWIMHSLSTQMAIRLRFNTLDSPLSVPAFKNDTNLTREWKRRVFWQLYTFDVLTCTLSDLPPCLPIHDVRCNPPVPLTTEVLAGGKQQQQQQKREHIALLGPAVVICDDQSTIDQQIDLLKIMWDISSLQSNLTPEEVLFPTTFHEIYKKVVEWQKSFPDYDALVEGNLTKISAVFKDNPGRIFLGLMGQYAVILLCLIKDTWLPSKREMTEDEKSVLTWARHVAYESAQVVHRLVPLVRGMRLNTVSPFVSCVVFQACIVSLYSSGWVNDPRMMLAAVNNVQSGLEFLEYVSPRWGFAGVLTTSLRSLVVERGFGASRQNGKEHTTVLGSAVQTIIGVRAVLPTSPVPGEVRISDDTKSESCGPLPPSLVQGSTSNGDRAPGPAQEICQPLPADLMEPFVIESQWEKILRTGEMPAAFGGDGTLAPLCSSNDILSSCEGIQQHVTHAAAAEAAAAASSAGPQLGDPGALMFSPFLVDLVHRSLVEKGQQGGDESSNNGRK